MRGTLIGITAVLVVLIGLFTIKIDVVPSNDTRIILEHTYKTYISPPCYEQAQKTNHLEETTLSNAKQTGYKPESICTEQSLKPIKEPLVNAIAEKLNLKEGKWDW